MGDQSWLSRAVRWDADVVQTNPRLTAELAPVPIPVPQPTKVLTGQNRESGRPSELCILHDSPEPSLIPYRPYALKRNNTAVRVAVHTRNIAPIFRPRIEFAERIVSVSRTIAQTPRALAI